MCGINSSLYLKIKIANLYIFPYKKRNSVIEVYIGAYPPL